MASEWEGPDLFFHWRVCKTQSPVPKLALKSVKCPAETSPWLHGQPGDVRLCCLLGFCISPFFSSAHLRVSERRPQPVFKDAPLNNAELPPPLFPGLRCTNSTLCFSKSSIKVRSLGRLTASGFFWMCL